MENGTAITPAIVFEPDGYRTDVPRLMGRQAAGSGFLRAAVAASGGRPVVGYTPHKQSAELFAATVSQIDAAATAQWLPPGRPQALRKLGHLYMPGPHLGVLARERLRAGPAAWSITGITHTTASHAAMDAIADLVTAPVMPWDALVCTSTAAATTIGLMLEAQCDYLKWRLGFGISVSLPQLPVIPLGVHCDDFAVSPQARSLARQALGIDEDEIVALFVGRLSFHAKAHPHAMYAGLQAAARRGGRKLVLVQCGWFANKPIEDAFRSGAASACPDVRCIFTDGLSEPSRQNSWAAADLFISLSDNIQETFGLSPIEAMAAGLPVVVTDWNGYKDTVRDGVDGFRIPTWMAPGGTGASIAQAHESGLDTYDMYCGLACQHVAVDHHVLVERLTALIADASLRARLGQAGRQRAREAFDWRVVFQRYQTLWRELDRLRPAEAAGACRAPATAPARLDPFTAFAHYATAQVSGTTKLSLRKGATASSYEALSTHPLYGYAARALPSAQAIGRMLRLLSNGPMRVADLGRALGADETAASRLVAVVAKMGLIDLADTP
jgi:glycosyltransferase involved in cell wall biosynthesis